MVSGLVGAVFAEEKDFLKGPICSELDEAQIGYVDCFESEALREIAIAVTGEQEYTNEEIATMKSKAVTLSMYDGSFLIELFPEYAPNHVNNFLKLVESGYYDGMIFHRIHNGFVIQTGDPNTKNSEVDRQKWGQGGPNYDIKEEFNVIQHDRGVVSMARSADPNSASSQFFIVQRDSNFLDGQYTAFGRLVPLGNSFRQLDMVSELAVDQNHKPLDDSIIHATILEAAIVDNFSPPPFAGPEVNQSITKTVKQVGGVTDIYYNHSHKVQFEAPYRWDITEGTGEDLSLVLEPNELEHSAQEQIASSGVTPQVMIFTSPRDPSWLEGEVDTDFLTIKGAEKPKILHNYLFENNDGNKAHIIMTTQQLETPTESTKFKTIQIRFTNNETDYAIIYLHAIEWFRYEVMSFYHIVKTFETMSDGEMKSIDFDTHPVFVQLIDEAKAKPQPESLPPARIGGCLIATASYGSELAPQVQLLREIRDNTVLQTQSGASFMNTFNYFYYSFSPTIADYERESPAFKEAVKLALTPLLASLTLLQHTDIDSEHEMLVYGIGLILLNIGMYFIAPALLITKIRSFYKLQ